MLNISFPSNLTANFFMIALPMLLTRALFGSAVEVNSMLKESFTISGMMMSSLPKFGNLTSRSRFWSITLRLCVTITFCLIPSIPLGVHSERSGFNHFPYFIFKGDYILRSCI